MNIVTVASIIILFTIIVGVLLALLFVSAGNMVSANNTVLEKEKSGYNPRATAGHRIMSQASSTDQITQAQNLAAQKAAQLPRGANMKIRPKGEGPAEKLRSASEGVNNDPVTATKIAVFHTWNGLQYRLTKPAAAGAPVQARPVAQPAGSAQPRPGVDYQEIAITDSMTPEEKRKAIIANSKAKAAAMKAAKASGAGAMEVGMDEGVGAAVAAATPTAAAPAMTGGSMEPVAGVHYEEIAITEGMSPDEIRKARITNSKAKSAAAKALKASGATMPVAQPIAEVVAAAPSAPEPVAQAVSNIGKPDLIEITEGMSPDEIRRARIENSKRTSAFNKALKAAGIDPASVK